MAEGLAAAWLPGRFDRRGRWLFDVAHNSSAVSALADGIREADLCRPIHALVGMLSDKDWETFLTTLRPEVDAMWISTPPSAPLNRRTDFSWVQQYSALDLEFEADFDEALEQAEKGAGTVLVTGSFHTVGDVMSRLPGFAPLG
jgi:dihydrofolate synthase/folylpolyglutamate synthase